MSVEQGDECDMLIAGGDPSRRRNKSNNNNNKLPEQHNEPASRGLTGWLSSKLGGHHSLGQRDREAGEGRVYQNSGQHLAAMSNWLYESPHHHKTPAPPPNRDHQLYRSGHQAAASSPEASYDILDGDEQNIDSAAAAEAAETEAATIGYSLEENDGFELGEPEPGRKSPNYPFYTFYHNHKRRNCCRLLFLFGCLLALASLFVVLLIQLLDLIQEQQELLQLSEQGGRVWSEPGPTHQLGFDSKELERGRANRWLVSSPRCHIPAIDPWHESIREYVRRKAPLNCKKIFQQEGPKVERKLAELKSFPLTFTRNNRLFLTDEALKMGFLEEQRCCYVAVRRSYENDDDLVYDEKSCYVISQNGQTIDHNLIKVMCQQHKLPLPPPSQSPPEATGSGAARPAAAAAANATVFVKPLSELSAIYTNVHSFIVRDTEEEEALDRVAAKRLNRQEYYNVVMVGVDTVSRLNAYRQLNETLSRLRTEYGALEFVGYNKVGENTFPNLVPLLTGLTPEQLTEIQCWQASNYSQETETGDDYMDNCKYLWNFYQELGYITYFSEDWPKASTFNYLKQGFRREPTTYYGRPFTLARDKLLLPPVGMGCSSCLLDRPLVEVDLDNLQNFIQINQQRPHFAFHWVNCPQHDDLNGASMTDAIFDNFFANLKSITHDDRTFVIFFSDHGYRWNDFVSTRVGHYESSLPLLTIAPPKRFIQQHPDLYENLRRHQSSLMTPFDMFKTLVAIRDLAKQEVRPPPPPPPPAQEVSGGQQVEAATLNGGSQLARAPTTQNPLIFEDPQYTSGPTAATTIKQLELLDGLSYEQEFSTLSLLDANNSTRIDRTCIRAGIPDNYCVCHEFEETTTNSSDALGAAYYLVYVHLYTRLKDHQDQCYLLDLERIHKAELFNFKQMKQSKQTRRRRRRHDTVAPTTTNNNHNTTFDRATANNNAPGVTTTTPKPGAGPRTGEEVIDEQRYLPSREYNIRLSTKPGSALFQEVVRYYGQEDMKDCEAAVNTAKSTIESLNEGTEFDRKYRSVLDMNEACRFSVHSDSISRLNLYKDQSKCVKSNIELKKICYCANLSPKAA